MSIDDSQKSKDELIAELQTLRNQYDRLEADCEDAMQSAILRLRTMETLQFSSLRLSESMDVREMLEAVLEVIFRLVPSLLNAHVFFYDPDKDELTFAAGLEGDRPLDMPYSMPRKNGLTYSCARSGESIIVEDTKDHSLFRGEDPKNMVSGAVLGVPLKTADRVIGVLNLGFGEPRRFSFKELDIINLFAMQAAIAIENARLYRQTKSYTQQIETMREQDRRRFEEINRSKDLLMGMVSHDLRNPISVVKGFVHVLKEHVAADDEEAHLCLSHIERGTDQMLELVTDLLDLTKLETGLALNFDAISINALLEDAAVELNVMAKDHPIEVYVEPAEKDLILMIDPKRMRQVLNNLMSNAVKYTPNGGRVSLVGQVVDRKVSIVVEDTGLGIPEDDIPKLFDKFFRVSKKSHAEIEGTGLGLAIVKSIIDQHGGNIHVESELGVGSRFIITLPTLSVQ